MSITKTHEVFSLPNVHYALFCLYGIAWKNMVERVGAVPMCPPVSPCRGAFIVHLLRMMRMFLAWKRRYADVRAGTQAPLLHILLERIVHGCPPLRFRLVDCA